MFIIHMIRHDSSCNYQFNFCLQIDYFILVINHSFYFLVLYSTLEWFLYKLAVRFCTHLQNISFRWTIFTISETRFVIPKISFQKLGLRIGYLGFDKTVKNCLYFVDIFYPCSINTEMNLTTHLKRDFQTYSTILSLYVILCVFCRFVFYLFSISPWTLQL